jgi:release factor glutamine methyltransferase
MASVSHWRRELTDRLKSVAGDLAAFESHRILGQLLGCGPTELTLRADEHVSSDQERILEEFVKRRLDGAPLAYVLGRTHFYGLELLCDSRALIPRPETEELVHIALEHLPPPCEERRPVVVDVGTGSGNIALAVAHERTDLQVIATDTERPALELAGENRRRVHVADRVVLLCGRTLTMFREEPIFDMIATNPPYIAVGDPNLEASVVANEPFRALFAGPSGLEVITELLAQSASRLIPGGWLICEIGYDQGDALRSAIDSYAAWEKPVIHRDMAGIERVLAVRRRL